MQPAYEEAVKLIIEQGVYVTIVTSKTLPIASSWKGLYNRSFVWCLKKRQKDFTKIIISR